MPKKIQNTTKAHLVSVPLPNHGTSYTVISHQFIMDYATQALINAGFEVVNEEYRCTADGQIAQGVYKLNFNNDPELSMMFAWTNSYNKQVKFKCVVGAYINNSGSVMISGEVGSWVRKHTGTADTETKATIDNYITNAYMYYNQLCADKAAMEVVSLNRRKQSQLLGVLFGEYEILTTEQASMVREQMKKPYQVFTNSDSLWAFYNFVTNALQASHPKTWMEDQRILHYFIGTICNFNTSSVSNQPIQEEVVETVEEEVIDPLYEDPNQTNLIDLIKEIENESHEDSGVEEDVVPELEGVVEDNLPAPCIGHDAETVREIEEESFEELSIEDQIVQYTDPVGNTFEAPIVTDNITLNETTTDSVVVVENNEDLEEDVFAEADDFHLDFIEDTNEDQDSVPDFF